MEKRCKVGLEKDKKFSLSAVMPEELLKMLKNATFPKIIDKNFAYRKVSITFVANIRNNENPV